MTSIDLVDLALNRVCSFFVACRSCKQQAIGMALAAVKVCALQNVRKAWHQNGILHDGA